ncbi:MAG TPA: hypothetical protein VNM46_01795 [Xanthobacteraceae bacterium]|jgi:hypothetical protein|nr:hypothetical protein [Xanthobacteraceae bacterium]
MSAMTGPVAELELADLDEMYEFLLSAEVVEGAPGFGEIEAHSEQRLG